MLEVADRGPGFPPGDEERMFEKFYRGAQPGSRARASASRSAAAIADAHGGTLSAENRPGGGALLRLVLPLDAGGPTVRAREPSPRRRA